MLSYRFGLAVHVAVRCATSPDAELYLPGEEDQANNVFKQCLGDANLISGSVSGAQQGFRSFDPQKQNIAQNEKQEITIFQLISLMECLYRAVQCFLRLASTPRRTQKKNLPGFGLQDFVRQADTNLLVKSAYPY